jgi:signal transduction histidine kinase
MAAGSDTTTTLSGTPYPLPPTVGMHLLRMTQESLNNALRHANAQAIALSLVYEPDQLRLTITDDGIGFDAQTPRAGFGLKGMQQRAESIGADLTIQSEVGQGTMVAIVLAIAGVVS